MRRGEQLAGRCGARPLAPEAGTAGALAARVHGEPLPVEARLAQALDVARMVRTAGTGA